MIWEGYFYSNTGYGEAARGYALALSDLPVGVTVRVLANVDDRYLLCPEVVKRLGLLGRRTPPPREVRVQHVLPHGFVTEDEAGVNVGYAAFDADRVPGHWVPPCNRMDEIWVPSRFCARSFADSGVRESKLRVIPHGVDTRRFRPDAEPLRIEGVGGFVFLSIFDWVRRKGWEALLRAYLSEFRAEEEVCLVVRSSRMKPAEIADFLQSELEGGAYPRLVLLPFGIPRHLMPRLYATANAFVVPSRGEGWCLPYGEAMATGLPTIATNWGGHLDYMDEHNAFLIDTEGLMPIDEETRALLNAEPYVCEAEPSVDHLRQIMRWVFEHPTEARARGGIARQTMVESVTWRHAATQIMDAVAALRGRESGATTSTSAAARG